MNNIFIDDRLNKIDTETNDFLLSLDFEKYLKCKNKTCNWRGESYFCIALKNRAEK